MPSRTPALGDTDIRDPLFREISRRHAGQSDVALVGELGLMQGANRIDLAVVNGRLEGYEIKSDKDTLERLPAQAATYGMVFERMTLVCGERYADAAAGLLPAWWGIRVASRTAAGTVSLRWRRNPHANPATDPSAVVQLLWRDEVLAELEAIGRAEGLRSKPKRELWGALAAALPERELARIVRERIRARGDWRSAR